MLTLDVWDLAAHSKMIWADVEVLKKRSTNLASGSQGRVAQATMESAWSIAVAEELVSVKAKIAASCVDCANFCWSAHSVAKG